MSKKIRGRITNTVPKAPLEKENEKIIPNSNQKTNPLRIVRVFATMLFVLLVIFASANFIYSSSVARNKKTIPKSNICIRSGQQAEQIIQEVPEVRDYIKELKRKGGTPFVKIDMPVLTGKETKIGYAYVGEQTENNSRVLFGKYLFVSGCDSTFQRQTIDIANSGYAPISFNYNYKVAIKTFSDEVNICMSKLSSMQEADFNRDGQPEILYGCFTGNKNEAKYTLYSIDEGIVKTIDEFSSAGPFEEITDLNNDGYLDVATPGIYMDEGICKGDACFAPSKPGEEGKHLLMRSYHHIWNKTKQKFDPPLKAEIYYTINSQKTIMQ